MKLKDVKSWAISFNEILVQNVSDIVYIEDALDTIYALKHHIGNDNVWLLFSLSKRDFVKNYFSKFFTNDFVKNQCLFLPSSLELSTVIKALEVEGFISNDGKGIIDVKSFVKCPIWSYPNVQDLFSYGKKLSSVPIFNNWHSIFNEIVLV